MRVAAILLAAGESTRMGSPKPLLPWSGATLVERQVEALLEAGVDAVCVVTGHRGDDVAAAVSQAFPPGASSQFNSPLPPRASGQFKSPLPPGDGCPPQVGAGEGRRKELSPGRQSGKARPAGRVFTVHNPDYRLGKTTSIKAGLAALPEDVDTIVILAVDQPRPADVTRRVLELHVEAGKPISSPRYQGHGGHPLVFSAALRPELAAISEEKAGLREVMRRHAHEINWAPFDDPVVRLDLNTPEAYEAALKSFPDPRRRGPAT